MKSKKFIQRTKKFKKKYLSRPSDPQSLNFGRIWMDQKNIFCTFVILFLKNVKNELKKL